MNQLFASNFAQAPLMSSFAFGMDSKKNQPNLKSDSLFSMALYEISSSQQPSTASAPKAPTTFYPSDEYKDLSLREILDLSEDCLFSDDEDSSPVFDSTPLPVKAPSAPLIPAPVPSAEITPVMSKEDLEWSELEEVPMMTSLEDIPVAAALVSSMDNTCPRKKRTHDLLLDCDEDDDELDGDNDKRFRRYQTDQWSEKFEELCQYRQVYGHCLVPHTYSQNLPLARWVKRQRYQYKLLKEGKTSTMTEDRVTALEDIGFVWDSQGAAWGERLAELKDYRNQFFHCNVPSNYNENPQLATWVKCQRRQYKLYIEGKPSNMTTQRIRELNELGFEWELRSYKKQRTN